jgi:hypothetical protein
VIPNDILGSQKAPFKVMNGLGAEDGSTVYSFSNLQPIPNSPQRRSDLTVKSTGKRMSNNFIRSYAIVKTPQFLLQQTGIGKR